MKAIVRSSSRTRVDGTSPATILQNRQSGSAAIAAAGYSTSLRIAMPVDIARLRATVEHLASFDRPSASEGERRAAEWIRGELAALGVAARVEEERAVGSMAIPLGLLSAAGVLAALGGRRTAALGLLAAAGIVDDVSGGPHLFRRLLPHRSTWNVVGEAGDPDAEETLVFVAHHDAANGGLIFRPELTRVVADAFPAWYERQHTSPQTDAARRRRPRAGRPGTAAQARAGAVGGAARSRSSTSPPAPWCRAPTTT